MQSLKSNRRKVAAFLVAGLIFWGQVGCAEYFLNPGPNPARIRVKLWAMVPKTGMP